MKTAILGDGGWGTALSLLLHRKGIPVTVWGAFPDYIEEVARTRENRKFLPGFRIPPEVKFTGDIEEALSDIDAIIFAIPSAYLRDVCRMARPFIPPGSLIISAAKGLERVSLKRMSEVIRETAGGRHPVALSGPSHAEEVARKMPTSVVVASIDTQAAVRARELLMEQRFRVYTHDDLIGVELGGAAKNVIAIAAGICDGMGFGDNTKAALLTRGMVEIARFGVALGAQRETFWGLSGIGDLIATAFSPYGRNLRFGRLVGEGMEPREALRTTEMVVEGAPTAVSIHHLARKLRVEMPIIREVFCVLEEGKPPIQAVSDLMTRRPKAEAI